MFLTAVKPLGGKGVWLDLLDQLRYIFPVCIGFLANPLPNFMISRRIITLRHPYTWFVYIFSLHNIPVQRGW